MAVLATAGCDLYTKSCIFINHFRCRYHCWSYLFSFWIGKLSCSVSHSTYYCDIDYHYHDCNECEVDYSVIATVDQLHIILILSQVDVFQKDTNDVPHSDVPIVNVPCVDGPATDGANNNNIDPMVRMYISIYVCMYECMYVCMYVCMYICMYVRIRTYVW